MEMETNIEKSLKAIDFQMEIISNYSGNKEKEELDLIILENDFKNFLIASFAIDTHQIESINYSNNQLNVKLKKG